MKDDDFHALFNTPQRFDDEQVFHDKVMRGLRLKTWFRQALIALSGIVGGLYALVQFVRVPNWAFTGETQIVRATVTQTDAGLDAGREMVDAAGLYVARFLNTSTDYLVWMQSPLFFWVSFSLCMAIVGLYLANVYEEAL